MSSDESEGFAALDDESGSDFQEAAPKSKPKPKPKAPPKPKAAPKQTKATTAKTAAAKPKKKGPLQSRGENIPDSEGDMSDGGDTLGALPPKASTIGLAPSKKSASQTYQKLTQLEHVLKRPDTYIGSVESIRQVMWVYDKDKKGMTHKEISFVPGLYKIVDEILVNAADNKQRDDNMDTLKVTIDAEKNLISVMNNGKGIPIEIHETEGVYIPELIFGHLLAGSNFDDDEKKTTGGRNGYGAKLANIYSTEFIVETADANSSQKYKQVFKNNMSIKEKPKITSNSKGEEYTKISFKPDLVKFNLPAENGLAGDMEALLSKRVYDMAGTLKNVKVWLNDERLKVNNFKKYVEMYTNGINEVVKGGAKKEEVAPGSPGAGPPKATILYEECGKRWEVAFTPSDGQFQQVSFCNSIATTKGGTHVDHVVKQLVDKITEAANKSKAKVTLKPFQVKNHLWVFVNCLIENPAFDSQTKENMTLGVSKFGSKCVMTDEFFKKVMKSGVIDSVIDFAKFKEEAAMKKTDGSKRSRITGIVKLEDANNAGTKKAADCTLILTEGDSAKSLAVAGLSVIGRDNYGVFPLRGKLLNVREASGAQLLQNAEIQHIKKIMGLQQGKKYSSRESLRYGSLMIMTDQDHDGSHIKGLIINFLDYFFPSLLEIPGFLVEFITPIVKVTRKKQELSFFTMPEFEKWKEENNGGREWKSKYYKGLGTSDAKDAKKYFSKMSSHRIKFAPTQSNDRDLIDMAFNKKKADNRKEWLRGFEPGTHLDHNVSQISYTEFINKELILFSMADNIRSIPSMVDGFKPGQRKVLFACFKRKLKAEIKVAQLGGYCAEHSAYHHGEQSLTQTIVGLAQNFVGSNNINFLSPNGQFGTRYNGGKDAASARYIFTNVEKITRVIFPSSDDHVLTYLTDDGAQIEPEWYVPILPMVLVNGSSGIGTGWSSDIPNYNPMDIVDNLRRKIAGEPMEPIHPWFRGFQGTIAPEAPGKYRVTGEWHQPDEDTLEVTELPIRVWNLHYKELLEAWIVTTDKAPALVKDYREYHTETTVHFIIQLTEQGKKAIKQDGVEKVFKLTSSLSTTNMVCFDSFGKIKKYRTPEDILDDFYDIRLEYYQKRKEFLVDDLTTTYERLSNQARFVMMIIEKKLVINNRKKAEVVSDLRRLEFRAFPRKAKPKTAGDPDQAAEDEDAEDEEVDQVQSAGDYDYLLSMAISRLTSEQVSKLLTERDEKEKELQILLGKSAQDLWHVDLDAFEAEWTTLMQSCDSQRRASVKRVKTLGFKPLTAAAKGKAKAKAELDSDGEEIYKPKATASKKASAPSAKPKAASGTQTKLDFKTEPKVESKVEPSEAPPDVTSSTAGQSKSDTVAPGVRKASGSTVASSRVAKRASPDLGSDEEDKPAQGSSKAPAAKRPRKAPVKKKPEIDDISESEDDFTIRATKAPAKKKAAPGIFAANNDGDDGGDDDVMIIASKKKVEPIKKKALATGKTKKGVMDDDDSMDSDIAALANESLEDDDEKPVTKKTKTLSKTTAKTKKVISDDSPDEDEKPVAKKTKTLAKPIVKSKKVVVDNSSDEDEDVPKKKLPQKRVVSGKAKKVEPDSESEDDILVSKKKPTKLTTDKGKKPVSTNSVEEPAKRPARARAPVKYAVEEVGSDENQHSDGESDFEMDED